MTTQSLSRSSVLPRCAYAVVPGDWKVVVCMWPKDAHGPGRIADHEYEPMRDIAPDDLPAEIWEPRRRENGSS